MRQRLASLISAALFLGVLYIVLDKLHIVIFVTTPWWAFILMGVVTFLLIDFAVARVFRDKP